MTTPKPAPSKPLTFTPPQYLKGETQSSELPFVEGAESNVIDKKKPKDKIKGLRPNVVIIDEIHTKEFSAAVDATALAIKSFSEAFNKEAPKVEAKKPFVLNPHLTQRPFHDDRLMQLKSRLQRPSFKNR